MKRLILFVFLGSLDNTLFSQPSFGLEASSMSYAYGAVANNLAYNASLFRTVDNHLPKKLIK